MINIKNVSYWYPDVDIPSLNNINLTVNEGDFILITGSSGCGKSTLMRLFNGIVPNYFGGKIKGDVFLKGKPLSACTRLEIVKTTGVVYQHPEKQIVLSDVEREIAFGLENLNMDLNLMKRNVAEVISFLNLSSKRSKSIDEISGGEKQKVAIASVIAMDPDILLFDEPTSELDPVSAGEVLNTIKKLNTDFGKTVVLIEQRLDRCFEMASRIIFMDKGSIIDEGTPKNIPEKIDKKCFLPHVTYIFRKSGYKNVPTNVNEARKLIENVDIKNYVPVNHKSEEKIMEVKNLCFEYTKGQPALKNASFFINKGEVLTVMGENGAGKTTLFKIIAGLIDNYKGEIKFKGKNIKNLKLKDRIKIIGYLSQNPNDYFGRDNVFDEAAYSLKNINEYSKEKVENILKELDILKLKNKNPRDLSGGEKQRTAIACVLVLNPDILILDEPTRGMDADSKENLGILIRKISEAGKSVVIITHDSDFAADYSDRTLMMFNGEITAFGKSIDILYDSIYYSPQVSKVFKKKCRIINSKDAINLLKVTE